MKPVCVECGHKMPIRKQGIVVLEQFQCPPVPYQAWMADLHECPNCHRQVASGFADNPFWQHFESAPVPEAYVTIRAIRD